MPRKPIYDPGELTPEIAADTAKLTEYARAKTAWEKHLAGGIFSQRTSKARQIILDAVVEAVAKVEEDGSPIRTLTVRLTPSGIVVHPLRLKFKNGKPRGPMTDEQKAARRKAKKTAATSRKHSKTAA